MDILGGVYLEKPHVLSRVDHRTLSYRSRFFVLVYLSFIRVDVWKLLRLRAELNQHISSCSLHITRRLFELFGFSIQGPVISFALHSAAAVGSRFWNE